MYTDEELSELLIQIIGIENVANELLQMYGSTVVDISSKDDLQTAQLLYVRIKQMASVYSSIKTGVQDQRNNPIVQDIVSETEILQELHSRLKILFDNILMSNFADSETRLSSGNLLS